MRRWAGINDEVKVPPTENFLLKWRSHAGCGLTCQPCVSYDAYERLSSHRQLALFLRALLLARSIEKTGWCSVA